MSRTTAPLLSFSASGQIAKTQVYATWKGRPYVRRYAIPSNPQTAEQSLTRNTFSWLNNVFKFMPGDSIGAWEAYADNLRITSRNAFLKQNLSALREETDIANMILSPSANSGLTAASCVFTPGDDQVTIAPVAPSLPAGWTTVKAIGVAIRDQDPQTEAFYTVSSGTDETSAYSINLTGLTSAVDYLCGAWFEYLKPNGQTAYGQSVTDVITTT